jgi:hypothetical protein
VSGSEEDFFACTMVVANGNEIQDAEQLIRDHFTIHTRRPPGDTRTPKEPNAFPFDDLRLYVRLPDDPALPPREFAGILFEIQVKTFLQHRKGQSSAGVVSPGSKKGTRNRDLKHIRAAAQRGEVLVGSVKSVQ